MNVKDVLFHDDKAQRDAADMATWNASRPQVPNFLSNLKGDGTLQDIYKLNAQPDLLPEAKSQLDAIQLNKDPLKALESFGMGTGDSPWATAQLLAQKQAQGQAMGGAKANAASANASAMDMAAARGGLGAGAGENLGRNASNSALIAGQNVIGQGLQQKGQIRSTDEANRLNMLSQLPGMEVQSLQPELQKQSIWDQVAQADKMYKTGVDQTNIQNSLSGLDSENKFNMSKYQNDVAAQAGHEQAQATASHKK